MTVRILDATASDFLAMDATDLKASIRAADGRTLAAEVICSTSPPISGISQGELAAAMGADIITLDAYDARQPQIMGAPPEVVNNSTPLSAYKKLLGRPLAINMVTAPDATALGGRLAQTSNFAKAAEQGTDIVFLYARPHQGGTRERQCTAAKQAKSIFGKHVMLVGVPSFSLPAPRTDVQIGQYQDEIQMLLNAGCDGIGLPMPGSKRGWLFDAARQLIDAIQSSEGLAWLFITGSVEGAPPETMHQLAMNAKQLGVDAVRLDEAGLSGMPLPENIHQFSLAMRGKRHTYRRMASSISR